MIVLANKVNGRWAISPQRSKAHFLNKQHLQRSDCLIKGAIFYFYVTRYAFLSVIFAL